MVNVTVEARNDVDHPGVVKRQGETWELNVWATTDELWKLADIEKTDWDQRRTLQVGTSAKAPVWWNARDGTVYIVTVPLSTVHNLLAELGEPPATRANLAGTMDSGPNPQKADGRRGG
jgi:hypothetical protein